MKRIFGLIAIGFCLIISGCDTADETKSTDAEMFLQEDKASFFDITEINQVYIDENDEDNVNRTKNIIKSLGEKGYTAIDVENKINMTEPGKLLSFIKTQESGGCSSICVFQISYEDRFYAYLFNTKDGDVSIEKAGYSFTNGGLEETIRLEFQADYFNYTDEGYLMVEGFWHSPQQYALTLSEAEEHIALRIEPQNEEYIELCEKYISPISYELNNMFLVDWNMDDYSGLDFYDVFERLYRHIYEKPCPYIKNDDSSAGEEYEVPAGVVEDIICRYFIISPEKLHILLRYDAEKGCYTFRSRGYGEYDYAEIPDPEVVGCKNNDDGSKTLLVNAVYPNGNTSKLFTHKVTVKNGDGCTCYLSNEVIFSEDNSFWWHGERMTDEEWNEYYKGSH